MFLLLLLGLPSGLCREARAELDVRLGGRFQSDLRFRVQEKTIGGFYNQMEAPQGVSWNQNYLKLKLDAVSGRFAGVADVDFVWIGYSRDLDGLGDLSQREKVDPYRLKAHALYLEALDLGLKGLDLRVGQQLVLWGKGDQFNPTNTLNPNDLEDVLLFGQRLANFMVRADYTFAQNWSFSGVLVPIFKPAVTPDTAVLGTADLARLPFVSDELRWRIHAEKALTEGALTQVGIRNMEYPTTLSQAVPVLPEHSLNNMQFSFRLAGIVGEQDLALSYYNGRIDLPQPFLNYTRMVGGHACNPQDPSECIDGQLQTETYLGYPRMQVAGLNLAGQVDLLGWISDAIQPLGYWLELGVYFPQKANLTLLQEELNFGTITRAGGEYQYYDGYQLGDPRPLVVEDTPFAKWTLGADYTFNQYLYANVQWVHGFPDEYGAGDFISQGWAVRGAGVTSEPGETLLCVMSENGEKCAYEVLRPRLADYLVLGVDVKFNSDRGLFRLFTIWDLSGIHEERWDPRRQERVRTHFGLFSEKGFSAIIYPELVYNFGRGLELSGGALLALGRDHTKFGDPATGGSLIWTRARFSF